MKVLIIYTILWMFFLPGVILAAGKTLKPVPVKNIVSLSATVTPNKYNFSDYENMAVGVIYDNRGNVPLEPQVQVDVKKWNDVIYSFTYPYPEDLPPIKPGSQIETSNIEVPIATLDRGDYSAEFSFYQDGKIILKKNLNFSVVGSGAILGVSDFNLNHIWPQLSAAALVLLISLYWSFFWFLDAITIKPRVITDKKHWKRRPIL